MKSFEATQATVQIEARNDNASGRGYFAACWKKGGRPSIEDVYLETNLGGHLCIQVLGPAETCVHYAELMHEEDGLKQCLLASQLD